MSILRAYFTHTCQFTNCTNTDRIASGVGGGVGFEFSCSSTRAAILVLPDGGERYDSRYPGLLHKYASENAHHWYRYFNGEQGMEIRNGSLYLVTGCDKCHSWGTACFHSPSENRSISLRFLIAGVGEVRGGISHRWEVQAGVHRRNHQCAMSSDAANQTIFLRGYSISVREIPMILKRILGTKSPVEIFKSNSSNTKGPPIVSSIPYGGECTLGSVVHDVSARDANIQGESAEVTFYIILPFLPRLTGILRDRTITRLLLAPPMTTLTKLRHTPKDSQCANRCRPL